MSANEFEPGLSNRVRRQPGRAAYDRDTVHSIFDAAPFCNVGIMDQGLPVVIPMNHAPTIQIVL